MIWQILVNGLIIGSLYAILALGFSIIYNGTKIFHIAYGAIYTSAVYFYLLGIYLINSIFGEIGGFSFIVVVLFSFLCIVLFSSLIEVIIYRPLLIKKASSLIYFISSLGMYIITTNIIALVFGNETKILNTEIEPSISFGNIIVSRIQLIQLIVSTILLIIVFFIIKKTSLGRNIRALSDNPDLLSVFGMNINHVRYIIFIIGSMLAASSSLLRAFDVGVDPYVGLSAVLTSAVAVIIAGTGSHFGAIVAALIIGIIQNIVVWFTSAQWQDAVTFLILTTILLIRREGLFVKQLRLEER